MPTRTSSAPPSAAHSCPLATLWPPAVPFGPPAPPLKPPAPGLLPEAPGDPEVPLGLYLHVPFCRLRCKFCYFRVYTEKNAREVEEYLDALAHEVELYRDLPAARGSGPRCPGTEWRR